jgi:hypothetical protein
MFDFQQEALSPSEAERSALLVPSLLNPTHAFLQAPIQCTTVETKIKSTISIHARVTVDKNRIDIRTGFGSE